MKKMEQKEINNRIMAAIERYNTEEITDNVGRLRSCTAWIYETNSFYVLQSYRTVIAIIDKDTKECFDFLRYVYGYTATSAQHVSKFWHDYGKTYPLTWREV